MSELQQSTESLATVHDFPAPESLTREQRAYWEAELEAAQRRSEYAARMLGLIATERGLEG